MKRHVTTHKIVCWRLFRYCNRSCDFCLSQSNPRHTIRSIDYQNIIARLRHLGVKKISYSGGEPILHPQFAEILRFGRANRVEQIVTSNGDRISSLRFAVDLLRDADYIKLSFYGNRENHDAFMGKGHFARLIRCAERLNKSGITVGANFMLSAQSKDDLREFLFRAMAVGVRQVLILTYVPTRITRIDEKYSIDWADVSVAIRAQTTDLASHFPGGLKVHNYAVKDFFIILNDDDAFVLPRDNEADWVMGNIYDDYLHLPNGRALPAAVALTEIWGNRLVTSAIKAL